MREADVAQALQAIGGRSFAPELQDWVHGRGELPLKDLLAQHGVAVLEEPAQLAQRLGLRVSETQGLKITTVLRGGAAERAGFSAGDEWLGVTPVTKPARSAARNPAAEHGWRMSRLDDLLLYAGQADKVLVLVSRDKRLMQLELALPPALTTWRLTVQDTERVNAWLEPAR